MAGSEACSSVYPSAAPKIGRVISPTVPEREGERGRERVLERNREQTGGQIECREMKRRIPKG
jgi:hypothetical protein